LGTGKKTGDELGCSIYAGVTILFTKRLKCTLHVGTNPEDLPMIIITGYDQIPPNTDISFVISDL